MKHRSVVASFIFRWLDSGRTQQQVALFRRSHHPNIRSYQGKYAPISGSIEVTDTSPELAAEREILEETQLVPGSDITLEFCGQSYSFEDGQAGRSWTIYTFGWTLEVEDSNIKIDWEHDSWSWFDPQAILDGSMSDQCVPKLDKSLQRVYFGPNGMFRDGSYLLGRGNAAGMSFLETVDRLKNDSDSGARVLALEALTGLHRIAESLKACPTEGQKSLEYWHALRVAAYHFTYSARPSMNAAIRTTLLNALKEIEKSSQKEELDPALACRILESYTVQRKSSDKIAQAFKAYVDQTLHRDASTNTASKSQPEIEQSETKLNIITISHSSTILAALIHLLATSNNITTLNLTILEARPRCEGATLASSLINAVKSTSQTLPNLNIKIVPESNVAHVVSTPFTSTQPEPHLTLIILGADGIDPHSNIINKTGSRALAILAKTLAPNTTKTIVLSETAKISPVKPSNLQSPPTSVDPKPDNDSSLNGSDYQPPRLLEAHPVSEVYATWSRETSDQLIPYLDRGRNRSDMGKEPSSKINVSIENMYFEMVSSSYITAFITEEGETSRQDIMRISKERRELEDRIFGDLYS